MPRAVVAMLVIFVVLVYGAVAWAAITRYRGTHNTGFLILGAGVLAWPVLSWLLGLAGRSILGDEFTGFAVRFGTTAGQTVAVFTVLSQLIQGALILIGILLIGRAESGRTPDVDHQAVEV